MAVENITLNLIPTGDTPSIHVAQFDVDRPFTVTLKEGEDDFTPTGYAIELQVRKVDNNIVTAVSTQISGNVVTFNTTEQMTACSGTNIAELQLTKDSQTFATLHFYLVVQRDILAGGVTSESDIYNLTEQIAAIVPEVIGDDYYNKEEVDEKIAEIPTFDPTNYYDKSDVNTLLNGKADVSDLPDMTNYYNKSETDALLNDKANVSDLPDMTDYYTKSEVDTKITDLYQIKIASGDFIHITDGGDDIPVRSIECAIGSDGFSQADIKVCGKNLFDFEGWLASFHIVPTKVGNSYTFDTTGNSVLYSQPFVFSNADIPITFTVQRSYPEGSTATNVGFDVLTKDGTVVANRVLSFTGNANKIRLNWSNIGTVTITEPQIEFSDQATTYEEYTSTKYTVSFGSTYNDGVLKYENGEWFIDESGTIIPITSSTRVKTISGENNIFSNTGACEVEYFTEKSDGIAELIKTFM